MPLQCTQLVGLIELEEGVSFQDAWEASPEWSTCSQLTGRYPQGLSGDTAEATSTREIEADSLQLRCELENAYAEILARLGR